jgi:hypothetical protein
MHSFQDICYLRSFVEYGIFLTLSLYCERRKKYHVVALLYSLFRTVRYLFILCIESVIYNRRLRYFPYAELIL